MVSKKKRNSYDSIKEFEGQKYSGMKVGGKHSWSYNNGTWNEIKISPEKWKFEFICNKERNHKAPRGSGASINTAYHWYLIADQVVLKLDENTYSTHMKGLKFKVGYKRPNWNTWSYGYKQIAPEDIIIEKLETIIERLKSQKKKRELLKFI